ncbi:nitroreductase family protein [Rhodococcus globerulus]|uniref:nitroreductase family protein n=1 Tax=Rhodococcus globerulus TaxID=33008 RepID=UPI001403BF82|nr:nitroreductase family protein [Rhodococcus globerulus]
MARSVIRARLPEQVVVLARVARAALDLAPAYLYDLKRYYQFSSSRGAEHHKVNLQAAITERYHSIEKGLSLPSPRPAFGAAPLRGLLDYVDIYLDLYGRDEFLDVVAGVLDEYVNFNAKVGVLPDSIPEYSRISRALEIVRMPDHDAGIKSVDRDIVYAATNGVDLDFFTSRSSVRQYSDEPILESEIVVATMAALKSPAVCNRQFGKIYAFTDEDTIRRLLDVQGGANGFASEIKGLAIVTTNLRAYWNAGQRNQAWVDGGLFAMSFILGLHAQGIGSVCLNWSKKPSKDQEMRLAAGIPQEDAIVMLIGFGKLREEYVVAASSRVPVAQALIYDGGKDMFSVRKNDEVITNR